MGRNSAFFFMIFNVLMGTGNLDVNDETPEFARLRETNNGTLVAEYDWRVHDIYRLLETPQSLQGEATPGPEFYTGQPGYRVRLGLTTGKVNPSDGQPYLGVWFTLVQGKYDDAIEWPFQYKFNLTLVDQSYGTLQDHTHLSMNPMTAICRLRKQFLRPRTHKREGDGCGKAFFIPHNKIRLPSRFVLDGSVVIRVTIFLEDRGSVPKRAKAYMRGHQLVSEFLWEVEGLDEKVERARKKSLSYLTSDLFYVNSESYMMVLQLSINPEDEHLGLFATLVPGDFDDTLEWPFSYTFELSIVDQSPGYLTLDRKGLIDPTSGICSLNSFTKPQFQPNVPCGFRKIITFHLLETRNFKKNGNILVKFTAILDKMPNFATTSVKDSYVIAEYVWRVPNIERKVQLARTSRLDNLLSERFYTSSQGYLAQLQLKFQNQTQGHIGLYLTLLEGEYDPLIDWPFSKRFDLVVIDQQPSKQRNDIVVSVDPKNPYITKEACVGSFWRPVGRNDACGSSSTVSYETLYHRKYIRYGAMLVKVTIFLEEIQPPRFATLMTEEDHLVAKYEWKVADIDEKVKRARNGDVQFLDSEKFYLFNNGYRMMLRLYPEKTDGHIGLYAVLTRGVYDNALEWPFRYRYQLQIMDQTGGKRPLHISRTTYPSTPSGGCPDVAFQKPDNELAEWSCGEGRMASHETLEAMGYKQNGGIKVSITVFLRELGGHVASISFLGSVLAAQFLWLLDRPLDRVALLKTREVSKVEGPVFYTSNQGYSLRVSLALNVVPPPLYSLGNHREDFVVGMYVTFLKGRHDALLRWPFPHTIILAVVDQTYSGRDVLKLIDPRNTKCPPQAFQRPTDPQNEHSCGFAALLSLDRLLTFVKDDSILIRTSVVMNEATRAGS